MESHYVKLIRKFRTTTTLVRDPRWITYEISPSGHYVTRPETLG